MIIYHGSKVKVDNPIVKIEKYNKDFYFGFYCTKIEDQAKRWAIKITGKGIVNKYEFVPGNELNIKIFEEMNDEWLDFIVACRSGKAHNYDIVEGPMADDQIYNYIQNYIDKEISKEAFWALVKFKKPTHQISFNTEKALKYIKFIEAYEVSDER